MNEKIMKQEAQYDWLKDEVHCLNAEMNNLQKRIDKAINYLKSDNYWLSQVKANDYLLDILKGSDKNVN